MNNADMHREMHRMFNERDFDGIRAGMTEDFIFVDRPRAVELDRDAFVAWMMEWTSAMSDACVTEARYIDGGTSSIALFVGRGTHDGNFGPMPASGNEMHFDLCEVFMYDDAGCVTGGEVYYDMATVMAQAQVAAASS